MAEFKIDFSKTVEVDWEAEKENWNEYRLKDGTLLKVKLILRGVRRATEQHYPDGLPIYMVNSINVVRSVEVPKNLLSVPTEKTQGVA